MPNIRASTQERSKQSSPKASPSTVYTSAERLGALLRDLQHEAPHGLQPQPSIKSTRDMAAMLRWFTLTDSLAILLGFVCSWSLLIAVNVLALNRPVPKIATDILPIAQFFLIGGGAVLWFEHTSHYHVRLPFWIETRKIVSVMGFCMLVDGFMQFAAKQDFSRLWLMLGWGFAAIGIISLRSLVRGLLQERRAWSLPTLLIGGGRNAEDVRQALASEPGLGYDIVGQIDDSSAIFNEPDFSWKSLCAQHNASYVVLALKGGGNTLGDQALEQIMRENIPFSIAPSLFRAPVYGMVPQYFFNHDVMMLTHNHGLDRGLPCLVKRVFDVALATFALAVFSPFLLVIAAAVSTDGGAPLFGHRRLGMNGKRFSCLKFRTMVTNGHEILQNHLAVNAKARAEWQRDYKLRKDPRVTRIGRFLRRTSLDELPQLINVLRGDMSIVGPRPIVVAEKEKYSNDISHYYRVRPGITGLWQVSGRNDVAYDDRVHMDTWYVHNWSVWHDIAIILKTVPTILKRKGAY